MPGRFGWSTAWTGIEVRFTSTWTWRRYSAAPISVVYASPAGKPTCLQKPRLSAWRAQAMLSRSALNFYAAAPGGKTAVLHGGSISITGRSIRHAIFTIMPSCCWPFPPLLQLLVLISTRQDALAVLNFITRSFPHPAGGYEESIPPARPRRQNPHMHLLEALLAANDAFGDRIFFDLAHGLIELFLKRLFQPNPGAIPEFFDDDLAPKREATRFLIEPGHHFEWIWLLDWYAKAAAAMGRATPPDLAAATAALLGFADCYGIDHKTGLVLDGIWSDGALASAGFRLWPQTERLKVEARRDDGPRRLSIGLAAMSRHLDGARPGLWFERIAADGTVVRDPAPATSLYHLTAALTDSVVLSSTVGGGKSLCC